MGIGPLYIVAAILIALPYGSAPVMGAAFARQRFGAQSFPVNLGIINCNIAIAAVINIIIVALLGSPAGENGPIVYMILAVLALIALISTFVFARMYKTDLAKIEGERKQ